MAAYHDRLALNSICSMKQTLDEDIAMWAGMGVQHVGLITPKIEPDWDGGLQKLRDAGVRVSSVSCYKAGFAGSVEFTSAVGADVLYLPPGGGGGALWEEAAEQFCTDIAPWVALGHEHGVRIAIEATNPLRTDVSFLHTLRDAVDVARRADCAVVVDFYSTWYERNLDETVRKNIDLVGLVQIGDFSIGTLNTPNRRAIGDGDIPVERLLGMMLDAGYEGTFELEIIGPPIEEEGYAAPIVRSLERASEMLDRLGA